MHACMNTYHANSSVMIAVLMLINQLGGGGGGEEEDITQLAWRQCNARIL